LATFPIAARQAAHERAQVESPHDGHPFRTRELCALEAIRQRIGGAPDAVGNRLTVGRQESPEHVRRRSSSERRQGLPAESIVEEPIERARHGVAADGAHHSARGNRLIGEWVHAFLQNQLAD
jgi:hypothetical protein